MTGGFLGNAFITFVGAHLNRKFNWSMVFTQLGYLTIIWVVLMAIFGSDAPEQYPKISESELEYIVQNRGNVIVKKKVKT